MHGNAANVDEYLSEQSGWKLDNLILFRKLVHAVNPDISEEIKWSVPVFVFNKKTVFAMSSFKTFTKYNFFNGAELADSDKLFNNGLESKKSRSIDLSEGQIVDEDALRKIIEQALGRVA